MHAFVLQKLSAQMLERSETPTIKIAHNSSENSIRLIVCVNK